MRPMPSNKNQISKFNRLLKQLDGYPAQAYLEYDAFQAKYQHA